MKGKIRVLIVDDHFMARLGLSVPIKREPDMSVVAEARNGALAVSLFREHQPDVVIMDFRLPDTSGPDVALAIRGDFPAARILMLSAFDGEEDIWRAVNAGVRGYLTKDAEREEVLAAIRQVHGGETVFPAHVAAKISARQGREPLIPREVEMLRLIVRGYSNKEIATMLRMSEGLVKLHVSKILEKLEAPDRTRAATLAIERGIVRLDE